MKKISKNFAFSLAEAMILVIILAIAVAASTPIMTKKSVNITEGGSTLTGGVHGRYEVFTKEIIKIGDESYEKTIDPSRPDPGNTVTVFRRLLDSEYIDVTTRRGNVGIEPFTIPNLGDNGMKETLYEQINRAKAYKDPSGKITHVDIKGTKQPVGGNIIIENPNLVYWYGTLSGNNRENRNFIRDNSNRRNLPTNDRRIIEGNLTKYYNTHPDTNNKLWHLSVNANDNNIPVVTIPWERLISGGRIIEDRPLCTNPGCVGTFDPGPKAKNVVIHAVGGGGAGGGIAPADAGRVLKLGDLTPNQMSALQQELTNRFNEVNGTGFAPGNLIRVVNDKTISKLKLNDQFPDDNQYIVINTFDSTITGKVDVRIGKHRIFPHQLLKYTHTLGAGSQKSVIYDMPVWGSFDDIERRGFYAAAVGCGCEGKGGVTYSWNTIEEFEELRAKECPASAASAHYCVEQKSCCHYVCAETDEKGRCLSHTCSVPSAGGCTTYRCHYPKCASRFYVSNDVNQDYYECPGPAKVCAKYVDATRNSVPYTHTFEGQKGGMAPPCAVACTKVPYPVVVERSCSGNCYNRNELTSVGVVGSGLPGDYSLDPSSIQQGKSCVMQAGASFSHSIGGFGGALCPQTVATVYAPYDLYVAELMKTSSPLHIDASTGKMLARAGEADITKIKYVAEVPLDEVSQVVKEVTNKKHDITSEWVRSAIPFRACTSEGAASGFADSSSCPASNRLGIDASTEDHYNHIYSWTIPFSINELVFGEGGQAGEYVKQKLNTVPGAIRIELGEGGVWTDGVASNKGKDGSNTTVQLMNGNNIEKEIIAKGGKGGARIQKTDKYELCYARAGVCSLRNSAGNIITNSSGNNIENTNCCNNEIGTRSTRDIVATAGKSSSFEGIKSQVGNSEIVGIGLGRSGEGAGSRAGHEINFGFRLFANVTGSGVNWQVGSVFQPWQSQVTNPPPGLSADNYNNIPLRPSELNFKGGDGAVIITW